MLRRSHSSTNNAYYCCWFTHTLLTYMRYGQVIGKCVNGPIPTSGIVRKFAQKRKKRERRRNEHSSEWIVFFPLHWITLRWSMNVASLHFHLLVLFPSPLCFSIILFFLLLMCLPFLPTPFYHSPASSSLFTQSLILSRQNYGAHYPPRPQTNDNNNSEMSSLLSLPLSLFLLLPLSSSLTFSCPSPKVAISHPFPARST